MKASRAPCQPPTRVERATARLRVELKGELLRWACLRATGRSHVILGWFLCCSRLTVLQLGASDGLQLVCIDIRVGSKSSPRVSLCSTEISLHNTRCLVSLRVLHSFAKQFVDTSCMQGLIPEASRQARIHVSKILI